MVKGGLLKNMSTVDNLPAKIHLQMKNYEQEKSVSCAVK